MAEILNRYLKICLLANGPQDLPHSRLLFQLMVLVYFITGCLSMWPVVDFSDSFAVMLVDLTILLLFSLICLIAFNKRPRFLQTVSALTGVGSLFQMLAWPLLLYVNEAKQSDNVPAEASFLLLVIISWNLAVYAHIFRQAFDVRTLTAFVITLVYVIINIKIRGFLFPDLGV